MAAAPHREAPDGPFKPYYSSRPLKYLEQAEWTIMQNEIRPILSGAQVSEFMHHVHTVLDALPAAKLSHIPANWYWLHAATIFLHYICFPKPLAKYHRRFRSVCASNMKRLLDYMLPKVHFNFVVLLSFYMRLVRRLYS